MPTNNMNENNSDLNIEQVDSIIAINILLNIYKIDVLKWTREELEHMVKLLQIALINPDL